MELEAGSEASEQSAGVVPLEEIGSDAMTAITLLQRRFHHLTTLRVTTARRHMTIVALSVAGLAAVGKTSTGALGQLLVAVAGILALLSFFAVAYDAMARKRAQAVTDEIARVAVNAQPEREPQAEPAWRAFWDEDFLFFSQIIAVSAATPLMLVYVLGEEWFLPQAVLMYPSAFVFFASVWVQIGRKYRDGDDQNPWYPSAGRLPKQVVHGLSLSDEDD